MGLNNPLPSSLASECKKCGKILTSFIDPRQALSPDKVIPPEILRNAKGLAILTVIKAGFLGSARFGSGLVVARLDNGSWSAPTAIMTGGAGFGGQIGFEITDFVFILNDRNAVKTFAQAGSITLGGNVSIAAGPIGRNAEAAGAASLKSVAGIFSYSKTKGLFAGVSLEGSAIIERKDANEKLYGQRLTAMQLLSGSIQPPGEAAPLMHILNDPRFLGGNVGGNAGASMSQDDIYNTEPGYGGGQQQYGGAPPANNFAPPQRASTWDQSGGSAAGRAPPGRPAAPKPNVPSKQGLMKNQAVASYTFESDTPGDLTFKKGEVITILKRTENETDWWTGMIGTRHGIFPSNYVKMQ
ncbi:SH3 domain-containing protein [Pestalotiopsis fici W106-1]|uniref:SH3 domain-containing protein n=1 Tax=Pestalotiopsis fici (strain W106-1 / CGMCC3.15140) TaxID=1229662 RepID=W3WW76_PESFW|nr:SH3 domain-containing protein [Pestalotiopsis fici W106-1]ETS78105.1 SH3 domain-containing protein [Pestalotiopsis fici W106-1]